MSNSPAFKEWSVVVDLLGKGSQAIILRKGGIRETGGQFSPQHDQFWLFPTGFHQHADKMKPDVICDEPALEEGLIPIQYYVDVLGSFKLCKIEQLQALEAEHMWLPSVIEERFNFGKWVGLYCFVVQVYQLPDVIQIEDSPEFGGCKSWIDIPVAKPIVESLQSVVPREQLDSLLVQVEAASKR